MDGRALVSGVGCELGGLDVAEGARNLGRYCGRRFSWDLVTAGTELTLTLSGVTWVTGTHRISLEYEATGEYKNSVEKKQKHTHTRTQKKNNKKTK